MKNVLGLIPARGKSKEIKRKNIRLLKDRPLVAYAIEEALKSKFISRTVVSTEDQEIADVAKKYGAEVPFLRPGELAEDTASDFSVIEHALLWFDAHNWKPDYIVFLRPTSIFRTADEIDKAIKRIFESDFDSIRAISKAVYPPYWMKRIAEDRLVNFIETGYELTRRQDLPKVYQGNGTIEVIKRETILDKKSIYGDKVGFIKMGDIAAVDIDTELDFKIAELLYPWWEKMSK